MLSPNCRVAFVVEPRGLTLASAVKSVAAVLLVDSIREVNLSGYRSFLIDLHSTTIRL